MNPRSIHRASSLIDFHTFQHHISPALTRGAEKLSGLSYIAQIFINIGAKIAAAIERLKTYQFTGAWVDHNFIETKINETFLRADATLGATFHPRLSTKIVARRYQEILTQLKTNRIWINHLAGMGLHSDASKLNQMINKTERLIQQVNQAISSLQSPENRLREIKNFIEGPLKRLLRSSETSPIAIRQIIESLQIQLNEMRPHQQQLESIEQIRTQLNKLVIPDHPLPDRSSKPLRVLPNTQIRAHNRRSVAPAQVPLKLRRSFEAAQEHLEDGNNSGWAAANINVQLPSAGSSTHASPGLGTVGIASAQGRRSSMEDAHIATTITVPGFTQRISLYGIFDGHGGERCAHYLEQHIANYLQERLAIALQAEDRDAAIYNLLKKAFVELGERYKMQHPYSMAGSTANIALVIGNDLWVANVGDTRTILSSNGTAIALSEDAKPNLPAYRRGAERRGGQVIHWGVYRVQKGGSSALAIGRAVGHDEEGSGVNPRAKVIKYSLQNLPPGRNFLLVGCDGLWDVASSQNVAGTVHSLEETPENIARRLVHQAYAAGSTDNISALVLDLNTLE